MNEPITTQPTDTTVLSSPPPAVAAAPQGPALPPVTVIGDPAPKIHSFFEGETGGYSMTRGLQALWFIPFILVTMFLAVKFGKWPDLPEPYIVLSASFLGFGVGSKIVETKFTAIQGRMNP